jgi:hypothetical protein
MQIFEIRTRSVTISPYKFWRSKGLSTRSANILTAINCHTIDDLRALGSEHLRRYTGMNVGRIAYTEIAKLMDWPLPPPRTRTGQRPNARPRPVRASDQPLPL